jgi:flagellar basal-body rod modification protein FlgD
MSTSLNPVNRNNLPVIPKGQADKQLGQTDFLRLMTTQLKQQDPFSPVDNQAMVAQMAQFSSVSGISEMNISLRSIGDQIAAQTALLKDIKTATSAPATPATE